MNRDCLAPISEISLASPVSSSAPAFWQDKSQKNRFEARPLNDKAEQKYYPFDELIEAVTLAHLIYCISFEGVSAFNTPISS